MLNVFRGYSKVFRLISLLVISRFEEVDMVFELEGKVALVTGGASGIGLSYSKELLRNGLKAVTLADLDPTFEKQALQQIQQEFGPNRAILSRQMLLVRTNLKAFKKTAEKFGRVDILVNNAGVMNDAIWEKEILINLNGTIHGILLGLEKYLPQYHKGSDALIVNIASVAALQSTPPLPVYAATKNAVVGLTRAWGSPSIYERTKVRVIAICPGTTITPLILNMSGRNLGEEYEILAGELARLPTQEPEYCAKEVIEVIKYAPNGTTWVIEGGQPTYEFIFPERETMRHNVLSHFK